MDNLTHSLTGILLARAGLNRLAPHATALAVVSSNLPDLDFLALAFGPAAHLTYHRGFTHSFAFLPLIAALPLPLWFLYARRRHALTSRHWLSAAAISACCVFIHLLTDGLTDYGTRLLLPFASTWYHADVLPLFDLWLWAALLLCVHGPMLARLVYGEIGARTGSGRGMAFLGLLLFLSLTCARFYFHAQSSAQLSTRLYAGQAPIRSLLLPRPWSPLSWTALVETSTAWHVIPIHSLTEFDPVSGQAFYKADATAVRASVSATRSAQVFLAFTQAPLWRITPASAPDGAVLVNIYDLRFGLPEDGAFAARFLVASGGRVLSESITLGRAPSPSSAGR
ncbi:MAG: metal-dependent hydrolase [Acidobacteria bacterium]|nr:metal-dependent hydrolase [Acidobacteriota bacterium]